MFSDYTDGLVSYLGLSEAQNKKLAYVENNGVVVMKVDDFTPGSRLKDGKRGSVRITSKKRYSGGLFVLDIAAMPYGNGGMYQGLFRTRVLLLTVFLVF